MKKDTVLVNMQPGEFRNPMGWIGLCTVKTKQKKQPHKLLLHEKQPIFPGTQNHRGYAPRDTSFMAQFQESNAIMLTPCGQTRTTCCSQAIERKGSTAKNQARITKSQIVNFPFIYNLSS